MRTKININKYNGVMNKLQDYIICEQFIKRTKSKLLTKTNFNTKTNNTNINKNINNKNSLYCPTDYDSLYWIFYIMQNGLINYKYNKNKRFIIEKEEKIKYIENIKDYKEIIKRQKLMTISDFENNLIAEKKININTFLNLCAINKSNVIIIKNKMFYEMLSTDDDEIYIVYNTKNINSSKYEKFEFDVCKKNDEKHENICSQYYQTNNLMCPIKSISYYKLDELLNICSKLDLPITISGTIKKKKKAELYEQIIQYLS